MLRNGNLQVLRRYVSTATKSKRYMQTIPTATLNSNLYSGLNYSISSSSNNTSTDTTSDWKSGKWSKHSLNFPTTPEPEQQPIRRSRASRFKAAAPPITTPASETKSIQIENNLEETPVQETTEVEAKPKKKRTLRPRKALITLTPKAMEHLQGLLNQPNPKMIRIGVKNRGCSGLTYHLEYVEKPGKFDELIEQENVKVLIDSKALFSIVGSEMDWLDDKLSSRFIFKNPNSKGTCGCGESFMV